MSSKNTQVTPPPKVPGPVWSHPQTPTSTWPMYYTPSRGRASPGPLPTRHYFPSCLCYLGAGYKYHSWEQRHIRDSRVWYTWGTGHWWFEKPQQGCLTGRRHTVICDPNSTTENIPKEAKWPQEDNSVIYNKRASDVVWHMAQSHRKCASGKHSLILIL